jgi:hypothetical protein
MSRKFILTVPREMHLGHIKETFGRGAVLELDEERGLLIIDGRKFDDTRDLEILERQAIRNPERPWIMPFSPELLAQVKGIAEPVVDDVPRSRPGDGMPIIQDDSDDHPTIDIRDTQISRVNAEKKADDRESAHNREVDRKMEIIRGDETAEERIARLKGKGDMNSMSERVAAKRQRATMPIVHDDSLGMGAGKSEISMNAGQHLPSREDADANAGTRQAEAEVRKRHVEATRKRAGIELPEDGASSAVVDQDIPPELAAATEVLGGTEASAVAQETDSAVTGTQLSTEDAAALEADLDAEAAKQSDAEVALTAENAELKAENAELKTTQGTILERLVALEAAPPAPAPAPAAAPRRRAASSKPRTPTKTPAKRKKTKTAKKVTRTPVSKG